VTRIKRKAKKLKRNWPKNGKVGKVRKNPQNQEKALPGKKATTSNEP